MIEKLDKFDSTEASIYHAERLYAKVNQLVDAANKILAIQEQYETTYKEDIVPMLMPENEEPADPYEEQCKWRGKVCRFWDDRENPEDCTYGVLRNVFDLYPNDCPFQSVSGAWHKYCKPVKPDDDIIYKGE